MNTKAYQVAHSAETMQSPGYAVPGYADDTSSRQQQRAGCGRCGVKLDPDARFCTRCGVPQTGVASGATIWATASPAAWRRVLAELIDCVWPFTAAIAISLLILIIDLRFRFWAAGLVVLILDTFRDCSSNRRSFGKRMLGLRVVMDREQTPYSWLRAATRRIFPTIFKLTYLLAINWWLAEGLGWQKMLDVIKPPWGGFAQTGSFRAILVLTPMAYFIVSIALMKLRNDGKRIEDFLLGTRVILESAYEENRKKCVTCEQRIPKNAIYCGFCGARNSPARIPIGG